MFVNAQLQVMLCEIAAATIHALCEIVAVTSHAV